MEFINVDLEKKVLQCLFHNKDLLVKIINRRLKPEVYADRSLRFIHKVIVDHFSKVGSPITLDILNAAVNRYALRSKNAEVFKEKLSSVIDRVLANEPNDDIVKNFDVYVQELTILSNGRILQDHQLELFKLIDSGDVPSAVKLANSFSVIENNDDVDQGDYAGDFQERERIVLNKYNNPDLYQLLPTGLSRLDSALEGGFDNEFVVISGSSNDGKSMLIKQIATNAYRLGKNVVFLCIGEMNKIQTQNRIDCDIADIDYRFFRNPVANYSKEVHDQWKKKIQECKDKWGKFEIIGFKKSATVKDVLDKAYEFMHRLGKPLNGIYIDALDNQQPTHSNGVKDWMSYEQICWDLFEASKNFKNLNGIDGIPLIATTQLKKANKEISSSRKTRELREDDVGSSPFQYRYSEVFIGMKHIVPGVISELQIMKGRNVSKSTGIMCFHNFPYGRYHDDEKEKECNSEIPEEEKKELKKLENMEIDLEE